MEAASKKITDNEKLLMCDSKAYDDGVTMGSTLES